jgi:hypothetical protein
MNGAITGCIFVAIQALTLSAQEVRLASATLVQTPKPAMQLILSPDHITVTPDSTFKLSVKWINLSNEDVDCTSIQTTSPVIEMYTYDIRASDGKAIPRIPQKEKPYTYPFTQCVLGPGQDVEMGVGCVMCAFDMRRPGVYTVRISIPDPAHPDQMLGTSNMVTITVTAPDTKAPGAKPAVQLFLSPDHSTTTPDGNLEFSLKWVNLSGEQQWCSPSSYTSGIDEEYIYDIRASDGKPVQRALGIGSPNPWSAFCTVAPGASIGLSLSGLMHAFDMRHLGVYSVQVSLPDRVHPGHMLGTSNKVTITVKAQ